MMDRKVFEELEEGKDLPGADTPPAEEKPVDKWGDFLAEDDFLADEELEPETVDEPQPEPAPEVEEKAEEEKKAPEAPAEAAKPQEQPEAPVEQLTEEQRKELRGKFEAAVATRYSFSDEEIVALQTEPETVLPKLAAKLYADVLDDVSRMMQQQVPGLIESYSVVNAREQQAKTEFFSAWPELKGQDKAIQQMGQMFRQMNPSATPQEAIQRIGELTMTALGMKREAGERVGAPAAKPANFQPAAPGRVSSPLPEKNKWERVMDDDD